MHSYRHLHTHKYNMDYLAKQARISSGGVWYPQLTLHWHFGWQSINWYNRHLGRESTIFDQCIWVGWHCWLWTECWSSVSQDVNQVLIECWPAIDWLLIVCGSKCWLTLAHNAFTIHDYSCIELFKIMLYYYYYRVYAWLHCKYLCMLLYENLFMGCPDKTTF